jgi:hypothetical protein
VARRGQSKRSTLADRWAHSQSAAVDSALADRDRRTSASTVADSVCSRLFVERKFTYDGAGRLITVEDITNGSTPLEEYAYDGNGNRTKAVSTYPLSVPLNAALGAKSPRGADYVRGRSLSGVYSGADRRRQTPLF